MIFPRKRNQSNHRLSKSKNNEDSTFNSDKHPSNEKKRPFSKNSRIQFINSPNKNQLFTSQNPFNQDTKSQKTASDKKLCPQSICQQTISNRDTHQIGNKKLPETNQIDSDSKSSENEQKNANNQNKLSTNKKKFKLFCEVKKNRNEKKKKHHQKLAYQNHSNKGGSEIKIHVYSEFQENLEQQILSQKKSELKQMITLRSKQKRSLIEKMNENYQRKFLQTVEDFPLSQTSSKKSINSIETKYESKFSKVNEENSALRRTQTPSKHDKSLLPKCNNYSSVELRKLKQKNPIPSQKFSLEVSNHPYQHLKHNEKNLNECEFIEQNQLSEIREEKHEDTVLQSVKGLIVPDDSKLTKTIDQSFNLGLNSICKKNVDDKSRLNSSATEIIGKSVESSLSELLKKPQMKIHKFDQNLISKMKGHHQFSFDQNFSTIEKIQLHIQIINSLSNFVYRSTELEYFMEDWEELNFLIYKRFYIERTKVLNFLKKYPIKNPFSLSKATIQTKSILKALKENEEQIKKIRNLLEKQNCEIKRNLEIFYQNFDAQKQGEKINLFEYDNFSSFIYKQLWNQIQLFSYSRSHNRKQLEDRICESLQAGFLICQLNGSFTVPFQEAFTALMQNNQNIYIRDKIKIFEKYVLTKKD